MTNWEDAYERQVLEPKDVNNELYVVEALVIYEVEATGVHDAVDKVHQGDGTVIDLSVEAADRIG